MSSSFCNLLLNTITRRSSHVISSYKPQCSVIPVNGGQSRRQLLFLLTATTAVTVTHTPSMAADIGLFGLRKKLKTAEEEAELIVKEGFESAEKGIEAAEKGIEAAEKEITTEVEFGFGGGLAQAGVVVGAEAVGVLIASSIVNGILGPESG
ncbi:uncharacterized protein LOC143600350 [Bidens hawaiensis]|uniref:uncharacterized protein LOC143600350 n=1 Tax=Bidens hawaiensis TaxID=980011 RepID=UPI0040495369